MPAVVVTAARMQQLQGDALPHTTLLTAEDIRASASPDLASLLQREAGIQLGQLGGPGQPVAMFVRGQSPSHSLILVDGVPLSQQGFTASPALEHISLSQIDSIEIVRGNASAIYGSGAMGGVIQIFTKAGRGQSTNSVAAELGAFATRSFSASRSGGEDGFKYGITIGTERSSGISTNNTRQYVNENPDRDGYRNSSASLSLSKEWAKGHEFGIRFYGNDARYAFDGAGANDPTDIGKGTNTQSMISAFSRDQINQRWQSTLSLTHTYIDSFSTSDGTSNPYTIRDQSGSTQLHWNSEHVISGQLRFISGASYARQSLDTYSDYFGAISSDKYSRNAGSVYAGVVSSVNAHQWQLNIRHDAVGGSGADTTGYLGYGYQLDSNWKLIGSVSTAFNAPTLAQRFDPVSGNGDLKAETARSIEAGVQYLRQTSMFRITTFYTKTLNQFAPSPTQCQPTDCPTVNLDSSHNRGVEFSANHRIGDTSLRGSLTVQDPIDDSTGKTLFRRAKQFGSVALTHTEGAYQFGADLQFSGSHGDLYYFNTSPYSEDKTVAGYGRLNLIARYSVSKDISFYARIVNALDRDYQTVYGYNQLPRTLYIGMNWQL